jgi:hypothetical protein
MRADGALVSEALRTGPLFSVAMRFAHVDAAEQRRILEWVWAQEQLDGPDVEASTRARLFGRLKTSSAEHPCATWRFTDPHMVELSVAYEEVLSPPAHDFGEIVQIFRSTAEGVHRIKRVTFTMIGEEVDIAGHMTDDVDRVDPERRWPWTAWGDGDELMWNPGTTDLWTSR